MFEGDLYVGGDRSREEYIPETDEDIVIRLLKKDFERNNGISFDRFIAAYNLLIENAPEKLI